MPAMPPAAPPPWAGGVARDPAPGPRTWLSLRGMWDMAGPRPEKAPSGPCLVRPWGWDRVGISWLLGGLLEPGAG